MVGSRSVDLPDDNRGGVFYAPEAGKDTEAMISEVLRPLDLVLDDGTVHKMTFTARVNYAEQDGQDEIAPMFVGHMPDWMKNQAANVDPGAETGRWKGEVTKVGGQFCIAQNGETFRLDDLMRPVLARSLGKFMNQGRSLVLDLGLNPLCRDNVVGKDL